MDITALLNTRPAGTTAPTGGASDGQGANFQGTLEAALARAASDATPTDGLTLLAGGADTPPPPGPAPLMPSTLATLAGDAATLLSAPAGSRPAADASAPTEPTGEDRDADSAALATLPAPTVVETAPAPAATSTMPPATAAEGAATRSPLPDALARQAVPEPSGRPAAEGAASAPLKAADTPPPPVAAPVAAVTEEPPLPRASGAGEGPMSGAVTTTPSAPAQSGPASAPASTTVTLQTPLASPAWGQELSQQMVSVARHGEQRMELHLNPRDLGPLSVSLKVDDHGAQAHFFSSHAPVRGALEQAIPQLRDALAEQGIALGEAMVGDQPRQFGGHDGNGDGTGGGAGGEAPAVSDGLDEPATVARGPATTALSGGVDLYA